jgi:hypothetical protein
VRPRGVRPGAWSCARSARRGYVTYADLEKMPRRRRPYHASRATAAIHGQRGARHRLMWIWQGSDVRTRKAIAPAEARASSIAAFAALAERLDALANRRQPWRRRLVGLCR